MRVLRSGKILSKVAGKEVGKPRILDRRAVKFGKKKAEECKAVKKEAEDEGSRKKENPTGEAEAESPASSYFNAIIQAISCIIYCRNLVNSIKTDQVIQN